MKKNRGLLFVLLLAMGISLSIYAETYYVDCQSGDDAANGTSPQSAWKTLENLNQKRETFQGGDQILFKRGGLWRGNLRLASGAQDSPLIYSSYGEGDKPRIYGSLSLSSPDQWTNGGENLWYTDLRGKDVRDIGNIILGGERAAWKRWRKENLTQQDDFWFDLKGDEKLWIFSDINPAEKYASVEAAMMRNIIEHSRCQWVVVEGLDLRYGAAHGFGGTGACFMTIRNCDLSWIGGGNQNLTDGERNVRYGNGIEFWESAHDCLVENCRLWEIYDAALTNQGNNKSVQRDITYRNNEIWNCEYSFEYWNRPEESVTENILFENNICRNAGYGWSHIQRPDPNGRHYLAYLNSAKTKNIILRGNLFENATESLIRADFYKGNPTWPDEGLVMENNTLRQIEGKPLFYWKGENLMSAPTKP